MIPRRTTLAGHREARLPAGHFLAADDLAARRPGIGISPMRMDEVVGRRLGVSVDEDPLLRPDGLDPPLSGAA